MSLLRYNVTTNDWVIFAPARAARPHDFAAPHAATPPTESLSAGCPFCPGNESLTHPEVLAVRSGNAPNAPDWRLRVVPNKFPALHAEHDPRRFEEGRLFRYMHGCGAHEVVVESPDHSRFLGHQPVAQIELLLRAFHTRHNELMQDPRFQMIVPFKNHGEAAGTSLRHPHCQIIATPVVPRLLRMKLRIAAEYFDRTGHCLYSDLLHEELSAAARVVEQNEHFAAVAPYASHVPFELWILPLRQQASFGTADPGLFRSLAEMLKSLLHRLYAGLDDPAFNLTINTAPRGDDDKEYFSWHVQIVPRTSTTAGFELGAGMFINTVLPENAADLLRNVPRPADTH